MNKMKKAVISAAAVTVAVAIVISGLIFIPKWLKATPTAKITTASQPFKAELSAPNMSIVDFYNERSGDKYKFARNPWDMKTFDGKIYVCCGDYDLNSGDTPIFYYDSSDKIFKYAGIVYTEQATRFYEFDGKLYTAASDPVAWGVGEFYIKRDDEERFDYYEALPSNIHCFDIVKFDNKFFFCGSVENYDACSMIQYIAEGDMPPENCEKTKNIYLYKNGKQIPNENCYRVYDMFIYKDTLYAWHYSGFYENEYKGLYAYNKTEGRFDYVEDKLSVAEVVNNSNQNAECESFMHIQKKFEYDEKMVFINNDVFYTEDLKNYTKASFGDEFKGYVPKDAIEIQGQLYVLASKKQKDGTYKTSVFVTEDLEHFGEVLNFETPSYINCFEYVDKTFVFGEGGTAENTADSCGNLYTCKVE